MNVLKNKKYKLAIILSGAALVLITIIGLCMILVNTLFPSQENKTSQEISFKLSSNNKPKTNTSEKSNDKTELIEKVNSYKTAEQSEARPSGNRSIAFSSVFKGKKGSAETNSHGGDKTNTSPSSKQSAVNDEVTQMLEAEIHRTSQPQNNTTTQSRPSSRNNEHIEREIRAMYNNTGPTSTPNTQSRKEKTPEELLQERKRQMEGGFSNTRTNVSTTSNETLIPLESEILGNIHGAQEVKNGGLIAIRLNQNVELNDGAVIPRNTICFGSIGISQNRANITIHSIKTQNTVHNVTLFAYSSDGLPGVPVNVSSSQKIAGDKALDIAGRSADQAVRSIPGGALVGNVVSELTRNSKREKEVSVSFLDNQRIYLRSTK